MAERAFGSATYSDKCSLEHAEIYLLRLPLKFRLETSFGVQTEKQVPLLLHGGGLTGLAGGVTEPLPI